MEDYLTRQTWMGTITERVRNFLWVVTIDNINNTNHDDDNDEDKDDGGQEDDRDD